MHEKKLYSTQYCRETGYSITCKLQHKQLTRLAVPASALTDQYTIPCDLKVKNLTDAGWFGSGVHISSDSNNNESSNEHFQSVKLQFSIAKTNAHIAVNLPKKYPDIESDQSTTSRVIFSRYLVKETHSNELLKLYSSWHLSQHVRYTMNLFRVYQIPWHLKFF